MSAVKLRRVQAGEYKTPSGRFTVRSLYDPSGAPHARVSRANAGWLVVDTVRGGQFRELTLERAREFIAGFLAREEKRFSC